MKNYKLISGAAPGSIAEEVGIEKGDTLKLINGKPVLDILEYKFLCAAEFLTLTVEKADGETDEIEIEKDEYEDLGIEFEYPLLSCAKACSNRCIFCFIDQLPKNMRKTLYFKDDDSRLSFLQGNYVTLTNLSEREIMSAAKMRISPINVSVHTTDSELRVKMMGNKNAGKLLDIMRLFSDSGIVMNCQIVLCRGINDGKYLRKSIEDLMQLNVSSVSVVPVGLSDHREALYPLAAYDKETASEVIDIIEEYQEKAMKEFGIRFVYAADEFYLKAERELPPADDYDGFPQIENGVGLIASMKEEFYDALEDVRTESDKTVSIATGYAAYDFISEIAHALEQKVKGLKIKVYKVENTVFGKNITVSGLLCGKDIINSLKNESLGESLYISKSMLRSGENVLLDDLTTDDLERELGVNVIAVESDGYDFVEKILGDDADCVDISRHNPYERDDIM